MPKRKLPPDDTVIEMYKAGMSTGEIAERCKVVPCTVYGLLRRLGFTCRTPKEAAEVRNARGRTKAARYWLGKKQPRAMVELRASRIRGKNHYLWKGGQERRQYRRKVAKDACAKCSRKTNLSIHHEDFDHYNDAPENLVVLCVSCHMSLHKSIYWKAIREGKPPPRSNGPIGWKKGGD